ncbi:MAG: 16S rRNA processing protein RimM [Chloroflexota bacterium]|nr:16S rRNA processing protein RimM [Chloroflexota bacterium]
MDKPRFLIIGRVLKPWSYRGELKIEILTEFPERFASLRQVFIGDDAKLFSVERARLHGGKAALMKLKGIDSTPAAEKLRNQLVQVAVQDAVPLPQGKLYLYQLIGLRVVTTDGQALGEIADVLDTGANDVYVVKDAAREILIPAIEEVVKEISLERGEIVIRLLPGLL